MIHGKPPIHTTARRSLRLLHALVALLGWLVFSRFWIIVFLRTPPTEAARGVLLLALLLILAVGLTLGWVRHNIRLFRHRDRRRTARDVRADFSSDVLGRPVTSPAWEEVRLAPEIEITVEESAKAYRIF
jgi:hypothetical protein